MRPTTNAGYVGEALSAQGFAWDGQAAALVVGETNPVRTVRRPEGPILFAEVVNCGLLLSIDPA